MKKDALPNARAILSEELEYAHWYDLTEPQKIFDTLEACMDCTYKKVRSACWGDHTRTIACDVLFKEAQISVALARTSMEAMCLARNPEIEKKEKATDWIQPVLLIAAAVLVLIGCIHGLNLLQIFLGAMGALCVLAALMREIRRLMRSSGMAETLLHLAQKLFKKKKWLKWLEKHAASKQPAEEKYTLTMNAVALKDDCLRQMDVIDSNLCLFHDAVQPKDDDGTLMPLVRSLLQEKYASVEPFPESLDVELTQYLHDKDLHPVEYDEQHAYLFQTQPMDETFTIFPAILDGEGCMIEPGVAGVKED